jgi:diguanylate cyclase (GGDEF)-like protein/PAS domain S-box-containing protein
VPQVDSGPRGSQNANVYIDRPNRAEAGEGSEIPVQLGAASDIDLCSAFENAPIGMAVLTPLGVIAACNAALGDLLRRPPVKLIGGTLFDVTHPDDLDGAKYNCALMQAGGSRILRHECRFLSADGSVVWVMISTSRVPADSGRPAHLIMHIEDISNRKALEAELVHRALHDPLTGLANRSLLVDRIDQALTGTDHGARSHCLLYLDLDGFKQVNDRYGHAAGDEVLRLLAERMSALLRPEDTAARLGGDEFAILCVNADPRHAEAIAERLRAAVAEPLVVDGQRLVLSATVGVSSSDVAHDPPPADPADLLRRADLEMYQRKRQRASSP